jgi:hypothetical protein
MAKEDGMQPEGNRSLYVIANDGELSQLFGYSMPGDTRSLAAAERMSRVLGQRAPIVGRYLMSLSRIPAHHLALLERRGTRIVFAPEIVHGMDSDLAAERRGRRLSKAERWHLNKHRSQASGTVAIYEPELDLIVFPTTYAPGDFDRAAHHEVGHALTMRDADPRPSLLRGLPSSIRAAIQEGIPADAGDQEAFRHQVVEALAEGYTYMVGGRSEIVPRELRREIDLIIGTVMEANRLRFRFGDA